MEDIIPGYSFDELIVLDDATAEEIDSLLFDRNNGIVDYNGSWADELSEEELLELWENDPSYVTERVYDFDAEKYINHGRITVKWSPDAVKGTKYKATLPKGKIVQMYNRPGHPGKYLAEPGTPYAEIQTPETVDRRELRFYRVQEDLPVTQSEIANQGWEDPAKLGQGTGVPQYVLEENAGELEAQGTLVEITEEEALADENNITVIVGEKVQEEEEEEVQKAIADAEHEAAQDEEKLKEETEKEVDEETEKLKKEADEEEDKEKKDAEEEADNVRQEAEQQNGITGPDPNASGPEPEKEEDIKE